MAQVQLGRSCSWESFSQENGCLHTSSNLTPPRDQKELSHGVRLLCLPETGITLVWRRHVEGSCFHPICRSEGKGRGRAVANWCLPAPHTLGTLEWEGSWGIAALILPCPRLSRRSNAATPLPASHTRDSGSRMSALSGFPLPSLPLLLDIFEQQGRGLQSPRGWEPSQGSYPWPDPNPLNFKCHIAG